ncbi:uncharacterized protein LOC107012649 isoform X2 [Solanum pennellii]|nr:uncharacterized protein LOC107012649 isoform X2 [Solanum pennellii]
MEGKVMEGVASVALIDNGSISGHFIHLPHSICYGIHGTEMVCERECSRGEDYRLVKLTIIDYNRKRERDVIVECRGHDAARIQNVQHAHGWDDDVVNMLDEKEQKHKILVSFECETLKGGKEAEDHINKFMPKLAGTDAVDKLNTKKGKRLFKCLPQLTHHSCRILQKYITFRGSDTYLMLTFINEEFLSS